MKISFITVCMNRLFHLKETLPLNIEDTADLDREFIILNYNSKDRMNEYLWNHFQAEIKSGLIKLYHTKDPKFFQMSHSKNVGAKQATGDIIINLDADNFVVKGFPEWLIKVFSKNPNSICRLNTEELKNGWSGAGKVAITKWNLLKLKGYDEGMIGWGYEDRDLLRRAKEYLDLEYVSISLEFIDVIEHSNSLRFENYEKDVLAEEVNKIQCPQIHTYNDITPKEFRIKYDGSKYFEQPEFDYWARKTVYDKQGNEHKVLAWKDDPEACAYFGYADWKVDTKFKDLFFVGDEVFDEHHKYPNHKRKLKQEEINPDGWGECKLKRLYGNFK